MKPGTFDKLLFVVLLLTLTSPSMATAPLTIPSEINDARAEQLQERLEKIKNIDTSELSRVQKKALRREVRQIKKELATTGGGVYLSVGALILIALLLILLL